MCVYGIDQSVIVGLPFSATSSCHTLFLCGSVRLCLFSTCLLEGSRVNNRLVCICVCVRCLERRRHFSGNSVSVVFSDHLGHQWVFFFGHACNNAHLKVCRTFFKFIHLFVRAFNRLLTNQDEKFKLVDFQNVGMTL